MSNGFRVTIVLDSDNNVKLRKLQATKTKLGSYSFSRAINAVLRGDEKI